METNISDYDPASLTCLNRTMQYGNLEEAPEYQISAVGLNRTMQYGNLEYRLNELRDMFRLNRTMQYGNFHQHIHLILVGIV